MNTVVIDSRIQAELQKRKSSGITGRFDKARADHPGARSQFLWFFHAKDNFSDLSQLLRKSAAFKGLAAEDYTGAAATLRGMFANQASGYRPDTTPSEATLTKTAKRIFDHLKKIFPDLKVEDVFPPVDKEHSLSEPSFRPAALQALVPAAAAATPALKKKERAEDEERIIAYYDGLKKSPKPVIAALLPKLVAAGNNIEKMMLGVKLPDRLRGTPPATVTFVLEGRMLPNNSWGAPWRPEAEILGFLVNPTAWRSEPAHGALMKKLFDPEANAWPEGFAPNIAGSPAARDAKLGRAKP